MEKKRIVKKGARIICSSCWRNLYDPRVKIFHCGVGYLPEEAIYSNFCKGYIKNDEKYPEINTDGITIEKDINLLELPYYSDKRYADLLYTTFKKEHPVNASFQLFKEIIVSWGDKIQDLFKQINEMKDYLDETKINELLTQLLLDFQAPSPLDYRYLHNSIKENTGNIKFLEKSFYKLESKFESLDNRLKPVEDKISFTRNVWFLLSLIGAFLTVGLSGWILFILF